MASLYDVHDLAVMVQALDQPSSFLLERFYPMEYTSDATRIDIEKMERALGLAEYIERGNPATVMGLRDGEIRSYRTSYLKPKSVIDPETVLLRKVGENPRTPMTAGERYDAITMQIMQDHRNAIGRVWTLQAAQGLTTGQVTVTGPNVADDLIDFNRDAALTVALAGAARWGQSGVKPLTNLQTWNDLLIEKSGAGATDIVFGAGAWTEAKEDPNFDKVVDTTLGQGSSANLGLVNSEKGELVGVFQSGARMWRYTEMYKNGAGAMVPFLPSNGVIMGSASAQGVRGFGAILNGHHGYEATDIAQRAYLDDEGIAYVASESSPLMILANPNATFYALTK